MSLRNFSTLMVGLALVGLGALFLAVNLTDLRIDWLFVAKTALPVLFVLAGILRLARHFAWSKDEIDRQPGKAGLLGGLFWLALGVVLLLDLFGVLETLSFLGLYWPVLLIVFGIGKIVDYYRFKGGVRVRPGEVFGIVFVISFGLTANLLSKAHLPLLRDWGWGELTLPIPTGQQFRFEFEDDIDLGDATAVRIQNIYGDVQVDAADTPQSRVALTKIVRAENRSDAEEVASDVQVVTGVEGTTLTIRTNREALGARGKHLTTHLRVTLPRDLPLFVENGFGDLRIRDRNAACKLDNSYGRVTVERVSGDVEVTNRYRQVELRAVEGGVTVENRRGPIHLDRITGNATVSSDYDLIRAEHIVGDMEVTNHFGTIRLSDISGGCIVDGTGSQVAIEKVGGKLQVRNSHKEVTVRGIGGEVDLETSYSKARLERVAGFVELKAVHSEVTAVRLEAGVRVEARGSQIQLNDTRGDLNVSTSLRRVAIAEFTGPVTIQNEYGEISIENTGALGAPIRAANRNGSILLSLPATASFRLSAQAVNGEIASDFGPAATDDSEGGVVILETSVGQGGPQVELQTTHSRIRIRKRG
jgi:DUF4097 and DUF4098 domain-containing protein YvlB